MAASILRVDYKALRTLHDQFGEQRDETKGVYDRIEAQLSALKRGRWQTEAAAAFYHSMDGEVLAAITRLITGLDHAGELMLGIIAVMQQAERDAAAVLPGSIGGVGAGGSGGGSFGGWLRGQYGAATSWLSEKGSDLAAWLDRQVDAAGTWANAQINSASAWGSQQAQLLQEWILRNKDTFQTIDDVMSLIPAEMLLALGPKGALAYAAYLGLQTGVKYLANYDQEPTLGRGLGIAATDTLIGAAIGAFGAKYAKAPGLLGKLARGAEGFDLADKINSGIQITGRYLPDLVNSIVNQLPISDTMKVNLVNSATQLSMGVEGFDLDNVMRSVSTLVWDVASAGAVGVLDQFTDYMEENGFPQFRQISEALGLTPEQNNLFRDGERIVRSAAESIPTTVNNLVEGTLDTVVLSGLARTQMIINESGLSQPAKDEFNGYIDAMGAYIRDHNLLFQPTNPVLDETMGSGSQ